MTLQDTYRDIVRIGAGGSGTVYKAYHIRMEKYVVLKKIHTGIAGTDIRRELNILKNLRHTYLPTVLDFIEDDGSVYTVMDYIEGETLEGLLQRGLHFTQVQAVKYARQLAEVLVYLHGQNPPIVHGDIKPANIMLTPQDDICLIDFNISQLKNGCVDLNMGYTPGYAAPEQEELIKELENKLETSRKEGVCNDTAADETMLLERQTKYGTTILNGRCNRETICSDVPAGWEISSSAFRKAIDERSDIYSVGATLYALLLGHVPDKKDVAAGASSESLKCSEGLAHLINRCMAVQPGKRFQSASEFRKAVLGIAKSDKRYRHLVFRQELAAILCMLGTAAGVFVAFSGHERLGKEKEEAYEVLMTQLAICRNEGAGQERFDGIYRKATELFPEYAEAYYQRAWYLYEKGQYREMIGYLSDVAMEYAEEFAGEDMGDIFSLMANGCMELEEFDKAAEYYSEAICFDDHKASFYADYAIALAKTGQLEKASRSLKQAVRIGGADDRIMLARGEISARQGLRKEAEECFRQCLQETEDAYITLRVYVMWGALYDGGTVEELLQKAKILEEGAEAVPRESRAMILELLAQAYIDLGELTQGINYNRNAIESLQKIVELGWDTYLTHNNIGILYEKNHDFESAGKEFEEMLAVYGEDYRTYKRLAFLEIDIQAAKDNQNRDYTCFLEYYRAAQRLFGDSNVQSDQDLEMSLLEQTYEQMKEGNWL